VQFLEPDGQPIGEARHACGVVTVPQAFGLAVAQGDVSLI
jgi:hypothetical protein